MQRRQAIAGAAGAIVGGVGGLFAASPAQASNHDGSGLDRLRLVFLSHVNDPATTSIFPGDPEFTLETVATVPVDGFYMQYVREGEHTGTHWGSPNHFNEGELSADQLDAQDLFLPAVKIDIRAKAAQNADYALTVADLRAWERRYGRIPNGAAVIAWTGWEDKWGTPAYPNLDDEGRIHQPGFGIAAAQWLVDTGRLGRNGSLGTDTFSPDVGIEETFAVSTLLYHRRRISLENLANLRALPPTGAWVLVGGARNKNGSGSTATIFGFIPPS